MILASGIADGIMAVCICLYGYKYFAKHRQKKNKEMFNAVFN